MVEIEFVEGSLQFTYLREKPIQKFEGLCLFEEIRFRIGLAESVIPW